MRDHHKSPLWYSKRRVEIKAQHHEISIAHLFKYDFHEIVGLQSAGPIVDKSPTRKKKVSVDETG